MTDVQCKTCTRYSGRKARCEIVEYDTGGDDPAEVWDGWEAPLNYCPECGRDLSVPDPSLCTSCEGSGYDIDEETTCADCRGTGRRPND